VTGTIDLNWANGGATKLLQRKGMYGTGPLGIDGDNGASWTTFDVLDATPVVEETTTTAAPGSANANNNNQASNNAGSSSNTAIAGANNNNQGASIPSIYDRKAAFWKSGSIRNLNCQDTRMENYPSLTPLVPIRGAAASPARMKSFSGVSGVMEIIMLGVASILLVLVLGVDV
jgi:hypothetical protein